MVFNLIKALGQRRQISGQETYFIYVRPRNCSREHSTKSQQSSVMSMFSKEGGWPYGQVKDTDPVLEKEKAIQESNPVRDVSHHTKLAI